MNIHLSTYIGICIIMAVVYSKHSLSVFRCIFSKFILFSQFFWATFVAFLSATFELTHFLSRLIFNVCVQELYFRRNFIATKFMSHFGEKSIARCVGVEACKLNKKKYFVGKKWVNKGFALLFFFFIFIFSKPFYAEMVSENWAQSKLTSFSCH